MKRKIKPFIRYLRLDYDNSTYPWDELLNELGYTIYENPIEPGGVFVSNIPLTWAWLLENYKRFDIKLRGWRFMGDLTRELDEVV